MQPNFGRLPLVFIMALTTQIQAADFRDQLGLQLWSLRGEYAKNPGLALDQVKAYGITEVEIATTGPGTAAQLAEALKVRGLAVSGGLFSYDLLKHDLPGVIRDAQTLGLRYVVCSVVPVPAQQFDAKLAQQVAGEFNLWGASLKAAGIRFGYHLHGNEFQWVNGGQEENAFDLLVRATDPALVCYEMDVFWVTHAGQNPVQLLNKYPDRWLALHLKDRRLGALTGLSAPKPPPADQVPVGTGQIDWPSVLRAAQNVGVKYYFVEDESPDPLRNIPLSLAYLRALKP